MKKILYSTALLIILGTLGLYGIGSYLTKSHHVKISLKQVNLPLKDVTFESKSRSLISGWFLQGKADKGGVLLMHGVKSNRLEMLKRAEFLFREGYSVLLFDFQGHGESGGNNITFGYLESLDANAAYAFLENKLTKKSIGIIGVSLGGASALLGESGKRCQALILESVYPTLDEAINDRLKIYFGDAGKYLTPLLTYQLKPRLNFKSSDLKPIEHIAKVTCPLFILAGENDQRTTLAESERLFSKANEPKQIWAVKDAGHVNYNNLKPKEYKKRVLEFFNKNL